LNVLKDLYQNVSLEATSISQFILQSVVTLCKRQIMTKEHKVHLQYSNELT